MSFWESLLLGIIQGLTEFLPISSTGHLTVAGKFLGLISESNPEKWTAFIAVIQLGTLAAVLVYFWKDIIAICSNFLTDNLLKRKNFKLQSSDSKMGWFIIIGSIPVVIIGLGFKDFIEGVFTKNLIVISISLIILGVVLFIAEKTGRFKKEMKDITWLDSLIIGLGQSLSLIPGSSRSGTTITTALFLGIKREAAARFSFLLSIPAVLGSGVLQFYKSLAYIDSTGIYEMIIATVAAAITGYLAIDFLLKFLKKNSTKVFVFYRIIIGILILILVYSGNLLP